MDYQNLLYGFPIENKKRSNLNTVVTFHDDMKNPKSRQMQPDHLFLDGIKYFMDAQQQNNVQGEAIRTKMQSVNPSANTNISPSSSHVYNVVGALLDLGMSGLSSKSEHKFHTYICDNIDGVNLSSDDTANSDDDSIDDLDYDSDFYSDKDIEVHLPVLICYHITEQGEWMFQRQ